ncbi:MAG: type I-F CRISPR-associated protein Csy1 [Methylobacter sp.]|jgi:CRISPR-associated protein Csy1|nr:type I-F CRISPR-associated protein Csy1 [Methylobacter sp.]
MLDPAIENFLSERKAARIKKNLKPGISDQERRAIELEATEFFRLDNWLPDAAKRAGWLSMLSHPGKFTHPSAKTSAIIAKAPSKPDGFLRTGNADTDLDVLGNAAALDVHKFLSLPLTDGQTVLAHLEQNSAAIQTQFELSTLPFAELQQGLLAIKQSSDTAKTSEKIKQVYFPVGDGYHLLSILTPSGLMFKLKEAINVLRFSDEAKQAREDRRHQVHNEQGFDELYNLSVIGFGGTKPQNISVLNNQNGGTAYLLPSLPPQLETRAIQPPKTSFFSDSLYYKHYQDSFKALHRLLTVNHNTIDIREGRDYWISSIAEQLLEKVWQFRQLPPGWSETTNLPLAQKTWLDAAYNEQRENQDVWLDEIIRSITDWFYIAYEKTVGKDKAVFLGDVELAHIRTVLGAMQEDLR